MVIFQSYVSHNQSVNPINSHGKPPFFYGFPMVFLWFHLTQEGTQDSVGAGSRPRAKWPMGRCTPPSNPFTSSACLVPWHGKNWGTLESFANWEKWEMTKIIIFCFVQSTIFMGKWWKITIFYFGKPTANWKIIIFYLGKSTNVGIPIINYPRNHHR